MKPNRILSFVLMLCMVFTCTACGNNISIDHRDQGKNETPVITVTDLIGRELTVSPGSYKKVVCIGASALRMYSYIGDVGFLCGVEDIDNTSLDERPKMFDATARPYVLAFGETFHTLPSCGVGGPNAQAAEAEKILACDPDIVISEYEDIDKENALQEQLVYHPLINWTF